MIAGSVQKRSDVAAFGNKPAIMGGRRRAA